jgi:hypothetical protein
LRLGLGTEKKKKKKKKKKKRRRVRESVCVSGGPHRGKMAKPYG